MVHRGIPFEPAVEVIAEAVVPVEFIEQLEYDARAEPVDTFGPPLPLKAAQCLRGKGILM